MKRVLLFPYSLARWVIISIIFLVLLLIFFIQTPSVALALLSSPLKEQGVSYSSIEGSLISGITIHDLNYQEKVKAKELELKVDWERLEKRVLYIDKLKLEEIEVDSDFLASLIDSNSSEDNSSDGNLSLPFDHVVIKDADISLKDIVYDNYRVNHMKLEVNDLHTDMRENHRGDIKLLLDSNVTKLNLNASILNESVKLRAKIEPNRAFVNPFLADQNATLLSDPIVTIKADGDMDHINYHLTTQRLAVRQNSYEVESKKLVLFGSYDPPKKDLDATISTELKGSMAYLKLDGGVVVNLDDLNRTLKYKIDTTINPKREFLSDLLVDQNVTLFASPIVKLKSSGTLEKLDYNLLLKKIDLKQNKYSLKSDELLLHGNFSVTKKDLTALLKTEIVSNVAELKVDVDTTLNLDDLNNTLQFNLLANVTPNREYVLSMIPDKTLSIERVAPINIRASGHLRDTKFNIDIAGLKVKRPDIEAEIKSLSIDGEVDPLGGDTKATVITDFDSSGGRGHMEDHISLNFKDLNSTLKYHNTLIVDSHADFINKFLKNEQMKIQGSPHLSLELDGTIDKLTVKLNSTASLLTGKELSHLNISTSPISLDIKNERVEGSLKLRSNSQNINLNLDSRFGGVYTKPKEMKIDANLNLQRFNAFGVNLDPISPIALNIKNSLQGALVELDSKKIRLQAKSPDYDHISFDLSSADLPLYKIIELPKELDKRKIGLNLKGSAIVSKQFFDLKGKVSSSGLSININAKNDKSGLDVRIKNKQFLVMAKGNIKTKNLKAKIDIRSLKELQLELNKLYEFKPVKVDGGIRVDAKIKGEEVWAKVKSPKLKFEGFNVESIDWDAHYANDLITLNKLSLKTTGFKDKKLNKNFYLNKKGKIHLGERRDVLLDLHPNILVTANGDAQNLDARVKIKKLSLGHPDYGSLSLNCDINYIQNGLKKSIIGLIDIRKMKLFYEAKFLDADYDPDVVVIDKDDKNKKEGSDGDFLQNTFIDLKIKASSANYRTPDIDLMFDINLKADKQFGKELSLLGKVEEINGRVDQVPKRFQVKNSNIVFKGGKKINPLLDINVEYELPQVLIKIAVGGYATRPKIDFTSEPPMPKKDIMSYLLLGVSTASLSEGEGSLGREAELFILNQAARDLAYEMEMDRVFIKDDGTGEGYAIEVGKKISKKNMFIIESSKEGNSFILEHDAKKNIKIRVGQHQKERPSQSIDIFFRKKFK